MAEYTTELRTLQLFHVQCRVCKKMAYPQMMRAIFRRDETEHGKRERVVGFTHIHCKPEGEEWPRFPEWRKMDLSQLFEDED